jgi:hypothetical protein
MPGDLLICDVEEGLADQAIGEEDSVEEVSLRDHKDQAEVATFSVFTEHVAEDVAPGRVVPHFDLQRIALRFSERVGCIAAGLLFDILDHIVGALLLTPQHQPARALRHCEAKEEDADAEQAADTKGETPTLISTDGMAAEEVDGDE